MEIQLARYPALQLLQFLGAHTVSRATQFHRAPMCGWGRGKLRDFYLSVPEESTSFSEVKHGVFSPDLAKDQKLSIVHANNEGERYYGVNPPHLLPPRVGRPPRQHLGSSAQPRSWLASSIPFRLGCPLPCRTPCSLQTLPPGTVELPSFRVWPEHWGPSASGLWSIVSKVLGGTVKIPVPSQVARDWEWSTAEEGLS